MKIDRIELYYVKVPLEENKPGFFGNPVFFTPSWIPGFRQSEMRCYLLKLGTDSGHEDMLLCLQWDWSARGWGRSWEIT